MEALKDKNLWILVSEGDTKAYPGMNDAVSRWEKLGTKATAPLWNSHADSKSMADLVRQIKKQDAAINYTVFQNDNHMYTWTFAYNIPGLRIGSISRHWTTLPFPSTKAAFPRERSMKLPAKS